MPSISSLLSFDDFNSFLPIASRSLFFTVRLFISSPIQDAVCGPQVTGIFSISGAGRVSPATRGPLFSTPTSPFAAPPRRHSYLRRKAFAEAHGRQMGGATKAYPQDRGR